MLAVLLSCIPGHSRSERTDTLNRINPRESHARVALSTNLVDYIYLLTPNIEAQLSVSRSVTLHAKAKYNAWSFNYGGSNEVKNRQQTYAVGARWWPWYTYSEWYLGGAAQYQEYDRGGIFRSDSEAGTAVGLVVLGGYNLHINRFMNIDFGLGFWGGMTNYTLYDCPYCGKKIEDGRKWFFLPDEARIALQFVF